MSSTSGHGRQGHDQERGDLPPPATGVAAAPSSVSDDEMIHHSGPQWDGSHLGDGDRDSSASDDIHIGSELARAHGFNGELQGDGALTDAGQDLSSGPGTLGAATGGERASAGRSDADRSSRDHGNSLGEANAGRTPT